MDLLLPTAFMSAILLRDLQMLLDFANCQAHTKHVFTVMVVCMLKLCSMIGTVQKRL